MNHYKLPVYCLLIIGFGIIITSCSGQVTPKTDSKPTTTKTVTSGDGMFFSGAPSYDPLFYIDGQLCQHLRRIHQDAKGNLWFGTNVYGLMLYDGERLHYFKNYKGLGEGRITAIHEDTKGNVWFGTANGLTKYNGTNFTNYTNNFGTLANEIWCFAIDAAGLFWVGTTDGVYTFDGSEFKPFKLPKADVGKTTSVYGADRITSLVIDKNEQLWFGTDGYGITRYNGENFKHITKENGLPDNVINQLFFDSEDNLWIGTMYGGVSRYNGKSFENFTQDKKVSGVEVGGFFEDDYGNIWFTAENNGVYCYNGTQFKKYTSDDGLNTNGALAIFQDKEQRFWVGGWGGLFRFNGAKFTTVTKQGPWGKEAF